MDATNSERATLSRVAEVAGVSSSTVSRVLNGRTGVSDATRAKIEGLLRDHDYNRRSSAPSSDLIELVFSDVSSTWVIETIRGLENVARAAGLSVVVSITGNRDSPGSEWIDEVLQREPEGIVLLYSDLPDDVKARLRARNIPFVMVDPTGNPAADLISVGSANWTGGRIATRHLIDLGHRDIALINGPEELVCARARASGYLSALEEAGIPIRRDLMLSGRFEREDGILLSERLLSLRRPPTAIFATSDMAALGVYETARRRGVDVPRDLSIVGYDDIEMTKWTGPPMTTVRQPIREMAEEAARVLLRLREGQHRTSLHTELETRLIVRESTAPLDS